MKLMVYARNFVGRKIWSQGNPFEILDVRIILKWLVNKSDITVRIALLRFGDNSRAAMNSWGLYMAESYLLTGDYFLKKYTHSIRCVMCSDKWSLRRAMRR
jgi:hypothetical protein